jgi:hypothetical protein
MAIICHNYWCSLKKLQGGAPQLAKLVFTTPISLEFMVDIPNYLMGLETNKHNWGGTTLQEIDSNHMISPFQMNVISLLGSPFYWPYYRR